MQTKVQKSGREKNKSQKHVAGAMAVHGDQRWCSVQCSAAHAPIAAGCVAASTALLFLSAHSALCLGRRSSSRSRPAPTAVLAHRTSAQPPRASVRSVARLDRVCRLSHRSLTRTLPHSSRHAPSARVDAAASGRGRIGRAVGRRRPAAARCGGARSAAGARHERRIEEKQEGRHPRCVGGREPLRRVTQRGDVQPLLRRRMGGVQRDASHLF